jgi:hypothetical protein
MQLLPGNVSPLVGDSLRGKPKKSKRKKQEGELRCFASKTALKILETGNRSNMRKTLTNVPLSGIGW